jgi:diguanylate cyclase (GGDEF)-like protein
MLVETNCNQAVSRIDSVIASRLITPFYQAIYDFTGNQVLGFEALARCPEVPELKNPAQLFVEAEVQGCLDELEFLCVAKAIEGFKQQGLTGKLFINLGPHSLFKVLDSQSIFFKLLTEHAGDIELVLELSEKYPIDDFHQLKSLTNVLHRHGMELAIDDLGAGYSGLRAWAEIQPDYVKVDIHFIRNVHQDSVKREFLRSIHEISRGLNCGVIVEGIELPQELETIRAIGINLGQGFLLQRPTPSPSSSTPEALFAHQRTLILRTLNTRPAESVGTLLRKVEPLTSDVQAEVVNDIFQKNKNISSLPVIDEGIPVGIVSRSKILELFSGRFSHQLFGRQSVSEFMDKNPVIVDFQDRLEEVSELLTENNESDLNTDFIIVKDNKYAGVGNVKSLLRLITDLQIRFARYSNPLTLLPGNVPIHESIDELLVLGENFHLGYFDLNYFKPFNDTFGYSRGDDVLKMLGDILGNAVAPGIDMVGHIGGDDFVILFRSDNWMHRCQQILVEFEEQKKCFYTKQALDENGIWCSDRQGSPQFFPLLSIAVGVVNPCTDRCHSHRDVAQLAADAKHQAKRHVGSHIFVSRRRGPNAGFLNRPPS